MFKSKKELVRKAKEILGVKLEIKKVSDICNGISDKPYKGLLFKYCNGGNINA